MSVLIRNEKGKRVRRRRREEGRSEGKGKQRNA
jgi:hypothetical protein